MAYNGSVTLISGLKQANNQNFPLVDAPAVRVTDSKRLNESLNDLENNKATKANPVFTGSISLGRPSSSPVGANSLAVGTDVVASGNSSHAEGYRTQATLQYAHAEGEETQATQPGAHAEGDHTIAEGAYSHAEGQLTVAHGSNSHTEGDRTYAEGVNAHAEGESTYAEGWNSHTEGSNTYAKNRNQHVFGEYNVSDPSTNNAGQRGTYIEIVGNGTATSSKANARALDWQGNERLKGDLYVGCNADSTGGNKVITGNDIAGKAESANPVFTGSISMGREANSTSGANSVAVGAAVIASGDNSFAEGMGTIASSTQSHAEGMFTTASGPMSHAEGSYTVANRRSQHVFGEYNIEDSSSQSAFGRGDYAEIVGNGTSASMRSNARALDWQGNEHLKGDLYIQCNDDSTGGYKVAKDEDVVIKANKDNAVFTSSVSLGRKADSTIGTNSTALGYEAIASGMYSHAEGDGTTASGSMSHAEGFLTTASGGNSHSEGNQTVASAGNAHAEGFMTTASAIAAHAEGGHTEASGLYSHAEGNYTVAKKDYQHVFGAYNVWDSSVNGRYVEIVGNGLDGSRSNARALDWDGNEYLKGDLYVGCTYSSAGGNKVLVNDDLSPIEDEIALKADKTDIRIINSLTFDNAQNEVTGRNSTALGEAVSASGSGSVAIGTMTKAKGNYSFASGRNTMAVGSSSHSEGEDTIALGSVSYTAGHGTISTWSWQHVFGEYNLPDKLQWGDEWEQLTHYNIGDSVYRMVNGEKKYYVCIEEHAGISAFSQRYWAECNSNTPYTYYFEIVGNGGSNADRSNARTLDRAGNERLSGNLYIECNKDGTGGVKVAKSTVAQTIENVLSFSDNTDIVFEKKQNVYIKADDGTETSSSGNASTDFIRVDMFSEISFKNKKLTTQTTSSGWAFYNANKERVSSGSNIAGASEAGYEDTLLTVPDTAVYFRTTVYADDTYGEFEIHSTKTKLQEQIDATGGNNPVFTGSISMGRKADTTIGYNSLAIGGSNEASGPYSSAFGFFNIASGDEAVASGHGTKAIGRDQTVFGRYNNEDIFPTWTANTHYNFGDKVIRWEHTDIGDIEWHLRCIVSNTDATFVSSHWEQIDPTIDSNFVEIVGNGSSGDARSNARTLDWDGNERLKGNLYVGCNADSSGGKMVATASSPVFYGSISMGRVLESDKKTGTLSSALGYNVRAMGSYSNVTGSSTIGMSDSGHVFGEYNVPEAEEWVANKQYHVGDIYVIYKETAGQIRNVLYFMCNTDHISSSDLGNDSAYWDFVPTHNLKYAEIVGNGYAEMDDQTFNVTEHRSNARSLDWNGNERLKGDLYVKCNADSTGGKKVAVEENPIFTGSISLGRKENETIGNNSSAIGYEVIASGYNAHAEGGLTTASGHTSHAEGSNTTASGNVSHAEGYGTVASEIYTHAEGYNTTSSGVYAHSEGWGTSADGPAAHSEGKDTLAHSNYSHAEGESTEASGVASHAENSNTTASGKYSHAQGYHTIANGPCTSAFGKFNVEDELLNEWPKWAANTQYMRGDRVYRQKAISSSTGQRDYYICTDNHTSSSTFNVAYWSLQDSKTSTTGTYTAPTYTDHAELVGGGLSDLKRWNIRSLDWNGNETLRGSITLGAGTTDEVTLTAAQLKQLLNLLS